MIYYLVTIKMGNFPFKSRSTSLRMCSMNGILSEIQNNIMSKQFSIGILSKSKMISHAEIC